MEEGSSPAPGTPAELLSSRGAAWHRAVLRVNQGFVACVAIGKHLKNDSRGFMDFNQKTCGSDSRVPPKYSAKSSPVLPTGCRGSAERGDRAGRLAGALIPICLILFSGNI